MSKRPRERKSDTLQVLTLEASHDVEPISPSLASFVAPLGVEEFMSDVFRKRSLAIKVHPKLRAARLEVIKEYMQGFHPVKMLETTKSEEGISAWMAQPGDKLTSIKVGPKDAMAAYGAGHALYFRGNELLEKAFLTGVGKDLGFGFASTFRDGARRSEIEVFACHVGHTTKWHFDFQENFTVQLRGRKRWSMYKSGVDHPHRACATHYDDVESREVLQSQTQLHRLCNPSFDSLPSDIDAKCDSVVLQPGDVLYHQAGTWHKVEALEDDTNSLSINLSFFPMTYGDLVLEGIQQVLATNALWRERIVYSSPAKLQSELARRLATLPEVVGALTAADLTFLNGLQATPAQRLRYVTLGKAGDVEATNAAALLDACVVPKSIRRNPLSVLSITDPSMAPPVTYEKPPPEDDASEEVEEFEEEDEEEEDGAKKEVEAPTGYLRYDVNTNFVNEENSVASHTTIFCHAQLRASVEALASLAPGATKPSATSKGHAALLKVLLVSGYLTPAL